MSEARGASVIVDYCSSVRARLPTELEGPGLNGREAYPVVRPDFKSGEGRQTFLVGSTPIPFRQERDFRQVRRIQ